jgi:hypothetical protein
MVEASRKYARIVPSVVALLGGFGCSGLGLAQDDSVLTTAEAKQALRALPYRFKYKNVQRPRGASGAFAARVYGSHHVWFDFGIALGHDAEPVPIPPSGTLNAVGNGEAGIVYTDNLLVRDRRGKIAVAPQIRTRAQDRESIHMGVEIEETLCKAVTSEPCPVQTVLSFGLQAWIVASLVVVLGGFGCSSCSGQVQGESVLTTAEAKQALKTLPYRF